MPDAQPTREPRSIDVIERDVLYLLTGEVDSPGIWSIADLGREVESDLDVQSAVEGLHRAGLVHRTGDGFVFTSRAAVRAIEFTGHVAGECLSATSRAGRGACPSLRGCPASLCYTVVGVPDRSRKHPRDPNQLGKLIVDLATGEAQEPDPDEGKDPAAVALGRKGGLKGGKARAQRMTAEERSESARRAALARWERASRS